MKKFLVEKHVCDECPGTRYQNRKCSRHSKPAGDVDVTVKRNHKQLHQHFKNIDQKKNDNIHDEQLLQRIALLYVISDVTGE